MKVKFLDVALVTAIFAVVASALSYTWTPTSRNSFYEDMSMSADGKIICICPSTAQPRMSTDWGQTWFVATNAPSKGSGVYEGRATLSANGSQIVACLSSNVNSHGIFLSTDFGTNWTKLNFPGPTNVFYTLASSADGSKLIAGAIPGFIYFSTDSGTNWSTASTPSNNWVGFGSSADGKQMVGAVNGGGIYVSTNFGADWATNDFPVQGWNSVCISADGKSMGATGTGTYILKNEGATRLTNLINGSSIVCSADGTNWMIGGTQVYTSSDGGVTWVTNLAGKLSYQGVMSADGCEVAVTERAGALPLTNWVGRITPAPQLNIQTTNGNADISWLLSSTNFVLQQAADLSSADWENVSNNPTLNFTNLHEEISVPTSGSNALFRLKAQ